MYVKAFLVGLSFVRAPADVIDLQDRLRALGAGHVGIVLKIENRTAFQNLPHLLLAGQRWPSLGIMIARGDLAVEIGFDRWLASQNLRLPTRTGWAMKDSGCEILF